jgi:hypothetical protein
VRCFNPEIKLWVFGSLKRFQVPTFGNVSFILTLASKWGCDSMPVWVSEVCQFFLVPCRSSNTPLYPSKCYELGSVPRFFRLPIPLSPWRSWVCVKNQATSWLVHIWEHFQCKDKPWATPNSHDSPQLGTLGNPPPSPYIIFCVIPLHLHPNGTFS